LRKGKCIYLTGQNFPVFKKVFFMFLKKIVFKKVLKSFRRVLKSKKSLKSWTFKKVQKVKKI
jgi:hypothetical protein